MTSADIEDPDPIVPRPRGVQSNAARGCRALNRVPGCIRGQRIADRLSRPHIDSVTKVEKDSNRGDWNCRTGPRQQDASEEDYDSDHEREYGCPQSHRSLLLKSVLELSDELE